MSLPQLRQEWPKPSRPRPIIVLGTGGIVMDAHLPAYHKAGFPVAGFFDVDRAKAEALAEQWGVAKVFDSLDEAARQEGIIFDVAAPPIAHRQILASLPQGAVVLIQKPMGMNLDEASAILQLCRARRFKAAVNFQLRFSPMMLAVRDALAKGLLGRLIDIEVHLISSRLGIYFLI